MWCSSSSCASCLLLATGALNVEWTPSGCCSLTMFGHLPTAFQQKLAAVGQEEYLGHMRGGEGTGRGRERKGEGREGKEEGDMNTRVTNVDKHCATLLTHQPTGLNNALMCTHIRTQTDTCTYRHPYTPTIFKHNLSMAVVPCTVKYKQ